MLRVLFILLALLIPTNVSADESQGRLNDTVWIAMLGAAHILDHGVDILDQDDAEEYKRMKRELFEPFNMSVYALNKTNVDKTDLWTCAHYLRQVRSFSNALIELREGRISMEQFNQDKSAALQDVIQNQTFCRDDYRAATDQ